MVIVDAQVQAWPTALCRSAKMHSYGRWMRQRGIAEWLGWPLARNC